MVQSDAEANGDETVPAQKSTTTQYLPQNRMLNESNRLPHG